MKLIKKIEIHYLRSLYNATLNSIGDINVIFGKNDTGKSNLLRALNLFFNDKTEPEFPFEFDLDFSDYRRGEAKKAKGRQFIWIKITFYVPDNFRNSLGNEVTIKRQWNRDGNVTETIWPHDLAGGRAAQLTKLRNQIDFTYIPAVKDLDVYADLIERMYGAAAETVALKKATKSFIDAIQGQTTGLSDQLTKLFGNQARIAPPTEMRRLFRALDFAHGEEEHSLLRQKGDGIKARHLPELLRFINEHEHGKKMFIWAFEEPENSLDLGAAEAEAHRFAEFASREDTQVFITSHSPAFYLANVEGVKADTKRFFITKQLPDRETGTMTPPDAVVLLGSLDEAEKRMGRAGIMQLPFVVRHLKELHEKNAQVEEEREELRKRLDALRRPTLFVEGKHDQALFADALQRVGLSEDQFDIQQLGGTPSSTAELLKSIINSGSSIGAFNAFFLFDNDKKGRKAHKEISGNLATDRPREIGCNVFVWVLPMTESFREFLGEIGIKEEQAFFVAEFLFPGNDAAKLCADLIELSKTSRKEDIDKWKQTIHGDYWPYIGQEKCQRLSDIENGRPGWLYARGVPDFLKGRFFREAKKRKLQTDEIDRTASIVAEYLTKETG